MCNECCTHLTTAEPKPKQATPWGSELVPVRFSLAKTLCRTCSSRESLSLPEASHSSWAAKVEGIISTAAETLFQTSPWVWHFVLRSYTTNSKTDLIPECIENRTILWHGQTGGKALRKDWIKTLLPPASPTQILHPVVGQSEQN